MIADADLSSYDRTISNLHTSKSPSALRSRHWRQPLRYDLCELGYRASFLCRSRSRPARPDRAIGADLDIVADDKLPDLRKLMIAHVFIAHESETVRTEHCACMHHHPAAQPRTWIDDDAWIQVTIVADPTPSPMQQPAPMCERSPITALASTVSGRCNSRGGWATLAEACTTAVG